MSLLTNTDDASRHARGRSAGKVLGVVVLMAVSVVLGWGGHAAWNNGRVTLGGVETVTLVDSGVELTARVDTGATVCSLHCPPDRLVGELSEEPMENVGRTIGVPVRGRDGVKRVVQATIVDHSLIRTAFATRGRYKVRLRVACRGVERETLVSLNDRSAMRHPFLIGRDFLSGAFMVDVGRDEGTEP